MFVNELLDRAHVVGAHARVIVKVAQPTHDALLPLGGRGGGEGPFMAIACLSSAGVAIGP